MRVKLKSRCTKTLRTKTKRGSGSANCAKKEGPPIPADGRSCRWTRGQPVSNGALTRAGACRSSSGCTAAPRLDPEVRQVRRMHRQSVLEAAGTCRRKKTCRDWLCYFFLFECERPRQHRRRPLEVLHADERRMRSPASPEESWALSRTQEGRATTVLMRAARSTLRRGVKRKSLSPLSIRPTAA